VLTLLACAWEPPALAEECDGALPRKGATFNGIVRYAGDGNGLCVGPEGRPGRWIGIRLADLDASELHERAARMPCTS